MADHAVGGVDRLVGDAARQSRDGQPEQRRNNAVGEILREAFDRGTPDARFVELLGIAADDHRHRLAAGIEAAGLQPLGDSGDMRIKTALRNQAAAQDSTQDERQEMLERTADRNGHDDQQHERGDAPQAALVGRLVR